MNEKTLFIKDKLKNGKFLNFLSKKGVETGELTKRYSFEKDVDKFAEADYPIINDYYKLFTESKLKY